MDLNSLSDDDLIALSKKDYTSLSDDGLLYVAKQQKVKAPTLPKDQVLDLSGPVPKYVPFELVPTQAPKREEAWYENPIDKLNALGEAGATVLSGLTTGTVAGAVGGSGKILDTIREGTFGTQGGVKQAEKAFHEQAKLATYEPRTARGQEYADIAGKKMQELIPFMGIMHNLPSFKPPPATLPFVRDALSPTKKATGTTKANAAIFESVQGEVKPTVEAAKPTETKYTPEQLRGVDEQMMQYPQDMQAPQLGMGGKVSKVTDQFGRERPKFEPGERVTQSEYDLSLREAGQAGEQWKAQQTAREGLIGSKVGKEAKTPYTAPEESFTGTRLPEETSALDRAIQKQKEGRGFDLTAEEKIALRGVESSFNKPDIYTGETPLVKQEGGTARRLTDTELAWEQHKADIIEQQKAEFALASERMKATQEPVTVEPSQRSAIRDPVAAPIKLLGASKNQRSFRGKQAGQFDPSVFVDGYYQAKELAGKVGQKIKGYLLHAFNNGPDSFVIQATNKAGETVGSVEFIRNEMGDHLTTNQINIHQQGRKTGLSSEMFRFASELGNDIEVAPKHTEGGKKMWQRMIGEGLVKQDSTGYSMIPRQMPRGTGARQGGASNFGFAEAVVDTTKSVLNKFKKKTETFDDFVNDIKKDYPNATEEQLVKAWEKKQETLAVPVENRVKQEAIAKITGDPKRGLEVYDGSKPEEIYAAIESSPELTKEPGAYTKWFAPKGQIAKELIDNPGVNAGISHIKYITDTYAKKSESQLFGPDGIITAITRAENPFGPGKISNLFKERFKAKDSPEYVQKLNAQEKILDAKLDELFTKNLEEVNAVREVQGDTLIEGLHKYFPSMFDGKFVFEVSQSGSKPVLLTSHSRKQHQILARMLAEKGFEVTPVRVRKALENRFGNTEHLVAEYQMMLDFIKSDAPEAVAVKKAMEGIEQASASTTQAYHQRFKEYSGFKGNLGDNPFKTTSQNFYDAKNALIRYQEAHNAWLAAHDLVAFDKQLGKMTEAPRGVVEYLSNEVKDLVVKQNAEGVAKPIMDVVESITGISGSKQLNLVRQYANLNTVRMVGGGSFRALTQNFFQPIEAVLPKFLQMYPKLGGGMSDIISPALAGMGDYLQVLAKHNYKELQSVVDSVANTNLAKAETKLYGVTTNELYKVAVDSGIIDQTVLESAPLFNRKIAQGSWKFASGLLSKSSEQAARFATFSTFTRWLIDAGLPKDQAILQAKQWTEGHMVDYSVEAKPAIMTQTGIVGEAAGRLQTYKATQLGRYVVYIQEAMKSGNTKPIAAMLLMNVMFAGMQGMIGMDVVSTIIDGVANSSKDPNAEEFSTRRWMAEKAPEYVNWGILSKATGLGLFNAFAQQTIGDGSLANMFPVYSGLYEQGRAVAKRATGDWEAETEGEKGRQLSAFALTALSPAIERKYLTQQTGAGKVAISKYTNEPTYTYKPDDYTLGNIQPYEKAKAGALRAELKKEEQRFKTGKIEVEKDLQKLAFDLYTYNKKSPFKQQAFDNKIQEYVQRYKGDPNKLDTLLTSVAIKSGMPKQELFRLVRMNKIGLEQLPEVQRLLKYSELMEKEK